jgi:hypothetical protein
MLTDSTTIKGHSSEDDNSDADEEVMGCGKLGAAKGADVLKVHYFLIALAGNEISMKADTMKASDIHALMFQKYNDWSELYVSGELDAEYPVIKVDGITKEDLMKSDCRSRSKIVNVVGGDFLWRKFGECKSAVINHMNILWREPGSGKTRDDVLLQIRETLWSEKEDERIANLINGYLIHQIVVSCYVKCNR